PKSASYQASRGYLVVYDDLHAVGIFKLNPLGAVISYWMSGPVVTGDVTISSGDLDDEGKLVLGLSDNSIMVVDVEQSLTQQNYVSVNQFATGLTDLQWIAPIHDDPAQV